jgi:hypothetical protein
MKITTVQCYIRVTGTECLFRSLGLSKFAVVNTQLCTIHCHNGWASTVEKIRGTNTTPRAKSTEGSITLARVKDTKTSQNIRRWIVGRQISWKWNKYLKLLYHREYEETRVTSSVEDRHYWYLETLRWAKKSFFLKFVKLATDVRYWILALPIPDICGTDVTHWKS